MLTERPDFPVEAKCGRSVYDLRLFSKFSRGAKQEIVVEVSFTHYLMQIYHDILRVYVFFPARVGRAACARQSPLRPLMTES
jgi:hypothetical protein